MARRTAGDGIVGGRGRNGRAQVLAQLELPSCVARRPGDYVLHPSMMDAALQASVGLSAEDGSPGPASLPFALEELVVVSPCPSRGYAWVRGQGAASASWISMCATSGAGVRAAARLQHAGSRRCVAGTLLVKRVWQARPVEARGCGLWAALVVLCGECGLDGEIEAEVESALPQARCVVIGGERERGVAARRYEAAVLQVLEVLQRIVRDKPKDDVLIQARRGGVGRRGVVWRAVGAVEDGAAGASEAEGSGGRVRGDSRARRRLWRICRRARAFPMSARFAICGGERQVASWRELPSVRLRKCRGVTAGFT